METKISLIEFIEARLTDDEKAATSAMESTGGRSWESEKFYDDLYGVDLRTVWEESFVYVPDEMYESEAQKFTGLQVYIANHIARFDPARILMECKAKRAVLEMMPSKKPLDWDDDSDWSHWASMVMVLEALAATYSAHPDYDPDWVA